jgi:hypothetical protein
MFIERGKVRLSDRVIFGLLGVAVLAPQNSDQHVPDTHYLSFAGTKLPINEWWGRAADFPAVLAKETLPNVKLDFDVWKEKNGYVHQP